MSAPVPSPVTSAPAPDFSSVTAAAALGSISSCTSAACAADGPITRPTTPPCAITAMSGWTPSSDPAIDGDGERAGRRIAGDDARRQRRRRQLLLQAERVLELAEPPGRRLLLLKLSFEIEDARLQFLVVAPTPRSAK